MMHALFSPIFLAPYLWLFLLLVSLAWVGGKLITLVQARTKLSTLSIELMPSFATFAALSSPLWLFSLIDEIQCRSAGLVINKHVDGRATSVYWDSHTPDPYGYSLGAVPLSTQFSRDTWAQIVRSLVEGRLDFVELPFEPRGQGISESEVWNQKIYLGWSESSEVQCMANPHVAPALLPKGTCLGYVTSQGIQSLYILTGTVFRTNSGRAATIVEHLSGAKVASFGFVNKTEGETLLATFGLKRLPSPSCSTANTRSDLIGALIPLVLGSDRTPRINVSDYKAFQKSPWTPHPPIFQSDPVPAGQAGIDFWVAKGAVRKINASEHDLWALAKANVQQGYAVPVPANAYLIQGPMRLPEDLYGGYSVTWVVPAGQVIPPGPRGHSTFYGIGRGCLWRAGGCDNKQ